MAPVRPLPLLRLAAAAVAVAAAAAGAAAAGAAASSDRTAVRQGGGYTAAAAPPPTHPCTPTAPPPRGGYVVPAPPPRGGYYAAGTRPPRPPPSGTAPPVAGTAPPVAGTSAPVAGTSPPVAGTLPPVASGTSRPAPSESQPPPSNPTPTPSSGVEAELPIPTLPPGCVTPSVESVFSQDLFFSLVGWQWQATLAVCDAPAARFRMTVYTAPAGATEPATRVYQAIEGGGSGIGGGVDGGVTRTRVPQFGGFTVNRSCEPRSIYGEACVADPTTGAPVCVRTETRLVAALPPPVLFVNSPVQLPTLALAPGDAVAFTTNVSAGLDEENSVPVGPPAVRLVALLRRADGTTRRAATAVVVAGGAPAVVRNVLLEAGVTAADDGAVAAVEVSRAACPPGGASTVRADGTADGGTVLAVSDATPSLVTQDSQAPTIVSVVYPPTAQGEPVNVTVTATNGGGGRRRRAASDGGGDEALVPTALTYQWLRQGSAFSVAPGTPAPAVLTGETAAVLRLPAAACLNLLGSCGRFGCSGLEQYQVDVCNTFGCVRSGIVRPAILRPDDEQLALDLEQSSRCTFVS